MAYKHFAPSRLLGFSSIKSPSINLLALSFWNESTCFIKCFLPSSPVHLPKKEERETFASTVDPCLSHAIDSIWQAPCVKLLTSDVSILRCWYVITGGNLKYSHHGDSIPLLIWIQQRNEHRYHDPRDAIAWGSTRSRSGRIWLCPSVPSPLSDTPSDWLA